jgi:hypothetical protein
MDFKAERGNTKEITNIHRLSTEDICQLVYIKEIEPFPKLS